jgi:hypothetical protein
MSIVYVYMKSLTLFFCCLFFISCGAQVTPESLINKNKNTIKTRFNTPNGYETIQGEVGSYAHYLQNLPLKPNGTDVLLYNGSVKRNKVHAAVVDMEIGKKDLQQCADAIMRLRGEYLYQANRKNEIAFNFTNGFRVAYSEWMKGNRMQVKGNDTKWVKQTGPSDTYADFRKYMDLIFNYAGTKSLEKELAPVNKITDIQIGDVFIQGGSPGHAVVVVNVAKNPKTGEKLFLLAQSYMPAQDIHILNNPKNKSISPWYSAHFDGELITPEWAFQKENLKRFK